MKYSIFYSFLRNGAVLLSTLTHKIALKSHLNIILMKKGNIDTWKTIFMIKQNDNNKNDMLKLKI